MRWRTFQVWEDATRRFFVLDRRVQALGGTEKSKWHLLPPRALRECQQVVAGWQAAADDGHALAQVCLAVKRVEGERATCAHRTERKGLGSLHRGLVYTPRSQRGAARNRLCGSGALSHKGTTSLGGELSYVVVCVCVCLGVEEC